MNSSKTKFQILGSSSNGNCAYLEVNGTRILIDAGFSAKRIKEMLAEIGITIEQIDAVFFTHDHTDHSQGITGLSQYKHLEFFANRDTMRTLEKGLCRKVSWQVFDSGKKFRYKNLNVESIKIPHDAYDPVAFFFDWTREDLFSPDGSIAWIQDLGYIPEEIKTAASRVKVLAIEANHDLEMLEADKRRPWRTKERIRGRMGHLNNGDILKLIDEINSSKIQQVFLTHLSRDCNCPHVLSNQINKHFNGKKTPKFNIVHPDARILPEFLF